MFKSKIIGFSFFFLLFVFIDIYCWQGVKLLIKNFSPGIRKLVAWIYWGYSVGMVVFFTAVRLTQVPVSSITMRFIGALVFAVIMVKLIWVLFLMIDDIQRFIQWLFTDIKLGWTKNTPGFEPAANGGISRSKFLSWLGLGIGLAFLGNAIWGVVKGAHNYIVRKRTLKIDGLPDAFDGFKIVQISDVHCGSFWDREAVQKGIDLINEQNADAVFFTGDLVNDTSKEAESWTDVFGKIKAKNGVFSILGNHDYGDYVIWDSLESKHQNMLQMYDHHKKMGWDLLLDENRILERGDQKIAIVGVENWSAKGRFPKYGDLKKALKGTEEISIKLLLSHDPSHWREQVLDFQPEIRATFSGHTHGMQFGVDTKFYRWSPAKYIYKEWMDLYKEGKQYLYVNRGFGYLGYPGRMGIFPEITVVTLRKK
jgi:predicted MPP superfamily phosphohydrolase